MAEGRATAVEDNVAWAVTDVNSVSNENLASLISGWGRNLCVARPDLTYCNLKASQAVVTSEDGALSECLRRSLCFATCPNQVSELYQARRCKTETPNYR